MLPELTPVAGSMAQTTLRHSRTSTGVKSRRRTLPRAGRMNRSANLARSWMVLGCHVGPWVRNHLASHAPTVVFPAAAR